MAPSDYVWDALVYRDTRGHAQCKGTTLNQPCRLCWCGDHHRHYVDLMQQGSLHQQPCAECPAEEGK